MSKKSLKIVDFGLFSESVRPVSKIAKSAKITVNEFGLKINTRNELCRCEIKSNSVVADEEFSFCVGDLGMFIKVLGTVENIHEGDFSGVRIFLDGNFLKIESKRFKTKISLVYEDDISKFIDKEFKSKITDLPYDYEVVTNSNLIKRLNNHSFMFSGGDALRVYLHGDETMGKTMLYSTIGCDGDDFENSVTFEFGMVTSGEVKNSRLVVNFEILNLLNLVQSDEIKIRKGQNGENLLEYIHKEGKDNTYLDLSVVCAALVK